LLSEHALPYNAAASHVCWSSDGTYIAAAVHDIGHVQLWRVLKTVHGDTVYEQYEQHKLNVPPTDDSIETDNIMSMQFKSGNTLFDLTLVIVAKHKYNNNSNCTRIHAYHVCSGEVIVAPIKLVSRSTTAGVTTDTDMNVDTCTVAGSAVVGATANTSSLHIWDVTRREDAYKLLPSFWYNLKAPLYCNHMKTLLNGHGFIWFDEFLYDKQTACLKKHASDKNLNSLLKIMFTPKADRSAAHHMGEIEHIFHFTCSIADLTVRL
jgi:WD40 repeat protein